MSMARLATWLMVPMPFLTFLISYWQGMLVHAHQTRPISEGVGIGLTTIGLVLVIFVSLGTVPGGVAATLAITLAGVLQAAWLAIRWNGVRRRGIVAAA